MGFRTLRGRSVASTLAAGLAVLASASFTPAQADVSVALGSSSESTPVYKVEVDRQFSLHQWHPALSLRLAGGAMWLPGDDDDDNAALLITPAFRYTFMSSSYRPFIEAGVGAAVFMNTHFEDRRLGSAFQFEDRLAAGMRVGPGELGVSATHYSNADIKSPNDGFEVYAVNYRLPL
ncbi:acyloxyacyl hydrolase [Halomonas shantousis]